MQTRWRFAKNVVANLGRGSAAAVVALLLPPVLVRHMTPASYSVWVLVLQVVAYMAYLDFGLQTAVGRYVAFANEKQDTESRDGIFSTALAGLIAAGATGMILIVSVAIAVQFIFPGVPADLLPPMRAAILILGTSMALGLPASAWNGVFFGLQRYEIPALTTGIAKLLSAAGILWAAVSGKSLVFMATVMAVANLLAYALQFAMLRRVAPEIRFRIELITKNMIRELSGYCLSLTVWSFSMLLITGFDLILVGRFQFSAITPYSVAATLITFLAGVQYAVFGVIIPHAAQLQARNNPVALGDLVVSSTKMGVLVLLLIGLPLIVFATPIIGMWIGPQFARSGGSILAILVLANMVRLTGAPYASILIGTGQQRLVIVSPLMEGVTNFTASILLGLRYGAVGVAWGTLVGAVVAVLANVFYNLSRTQDSISCSKFRYVGEGMILPGLCGIPVCIALLVARLLPSIANQIDTLGWLLSSLACVLVIIGSGMKVGRAAVPFELGQP